MATNQMEKEAHVTYMGAKLTNGQFARLMVVEYGQRALDTWPEVLCGYDELPQEQRNRIHFIINLAIDKVCKALNIDKIYDILETFDA